MFAWSPLHVAGCCCCDDCRCLFLSPPSSPPSFHSAIRRANPWRHFRLMRATWLGGLIIFPSVCIIGGVLSDHGTVITNTSCRQTQPLWPHACTLYWSFLRVLSFQFSILTYIAVALVFIHLQFAIIGRHILKMKKKTGKLNYLIFRLTSWSSADSTHS